MVQRPGAADGIPAGLQPAAQESRWLRSQPARCRRGRQHRRTRVEVRTGPDIVKIDQSVVASAVANESVRKMLLHAVSLLHEMGTLVLLEGVESKEEALMAIESDADFASGFYFGPLYDDVDEFDEPGGVLDNLWSSYKEQDEPGQTHEVESRASLDEETLYSSHIKKLRSSSPSDIHRYRDERRPFIAAIQRAGILIETGASLEAACAGFLQT